jgi:GT2 family glycosyltransferase
MHYPRVALMVLNFNGLYYLKDCLDSVKQSQYPNLEIYVIDNASTDDSCRFVSSNYPEIKLVKFEKNLGFAEAYDTAVKAIAADYVVLLNNDTQVEANFVQELVETAESSGDVGSVGCRIVQLEGPRRYGPVFFTGNGLFIGPLFWGSTIGKDAVYSVYEKAAECVANSAAAVLYRKSLIDQIGLFDPDFWSDWEDHDLGFRICLAGYRNLYTPRTTVLHKGAAGFGSVDSRERVVRITRNMLFTYVKNYEARNIVLRFLPLLFGIFPYRDLAVILENEFGLLLGRDSARRRKLRSTYLASAASYWKFVIELKHVMQKRQIVQHLRQTSDANIIQHTSKPLI